MKLKRKKLLLVPIILIGFLIGYITANMTLEKVMPPEQAQIMTFDLLEALGAQPNYHRETESGSYLVGQFAQRQKDWNTAYKNIKKVSKKSNDNLDLKRHLMVLAMGQGDLKQATKLAHEVAELDGENLLAHLFIAINNFKKGDYQEATKTLDNLKQQGPATFLVPVLKLWASAGIGELNSIDLPPSSFYAHHALLVHHYLEPSPALLQYALKSYQTDDIDLRDVVKFADLLVVSNNKNMALNFYKAIEAGGFANQETKEKIKTIENNGDILSLINLPNINNATEGAAIVFEDMASILIREKSDDSAIIFARMALALNPDLYRNHLIIGASLSAHDQDDQAIDILSEVPSDSEHYILAQRNIADIHAENESYELAIDILSKLYDNGDIDSLIQIGDIYRYKEEYKEAVKVYSEVLSKWDEVPESYWHVYYSRGMSYERLKEFKKSESDLLVALKFQPNNPYVLNYLAYSWADQGINLEKSLSMLILATQLQPDDGYIADSLGWVFYKMNDFESAIPHLERAVELEPYDATINDHLGDAYWQVGRQNEARFQWERTVNNSEENEAELKEKAQDKLANGIENLEPAPKNTLSEVYIKENGV